MDPVGSPIGPVEERCDRSGAGSRPVGTVRAVRS